jgi:hypothetical protein
MNYPMMFPVFHQQSPERPDDRVPARVRAAMSLIEYFGNELRVQVVPGQVSNSEVEPRKLEVEEVKLHRQAIETLCEYLSGTLKEDAREKSARRLQDVGGGKKTILTCPMCGGGGGPKRQCPLCNGCGTLLAQPHVKTEE